MPYVSNFTRLGPNTKTLSWITFNSVFLQSTQPRRSGLSKNEKTVKAVLLLDKADHEYFKRVYGPTIGMSEAVRVLMRKHIKKLKDKTAPVNLGDLHDNE
jgi:hypothetical protein